MDPLSISASIAGLINLTDILFHRTYKYVKAAKHASQEIEDLSSEILALQSVLKRLEIVSDQLEIGSTEPMMRTDNIHACRKTLERIKIVLEKDSDSTLPDRRLITLKQRLKWPFKSSQVKDFIGEIERHKNTLGLALDADVFSGLVGALSRQDRMIEGIEGVRDEIRLRFEADTRIAMNKHRQETLDSFGSINARKGLDMSRKLRQANTGIWLTEGEDFKRWLDTTNGRLWLYGIPGAGKTILASLVIDEVLERSTEEYAVAYFFCDYKDVETQESAKILGSLIQQLAKQNEQSFKKVQNFYEKFGGSQAQHFEYDATNLSSLLTSLARDYTSTVIVVDGLDECGNNSAEVTELLGSLSSVGADLDLKTLLLSRDEHDIRVCLQECPSISIAAQSGDLRVYVDAEIEKRTRQKKLNIRNHDLRELVRDTLIQEAEGMFRWVTCQIDYLCELPNDAARRRALKSLPRGLYPTYERILRRVIESPPQAQILVQRTLRWVSAKYTISTRALCEAVSIEEGDTSRDEEAICDEQTILRHCSSLIRLSEDEKRFEFAHFTVEEFLRNICAINDEFANFSINPDEVGRYVATACLTYLNFEDFNKAGRATKEATRERFEDYPFRKAIIECFDLNLAYDDLDKDNEGFALLIRLFHPSKPNTLISWVGDFLMAEFSDLIDNHKCDDETGKLTKSDNTLLAVNRYLAEATPLHYAAMWSISQLCKFLVERGLDIDRKTAFGTPLHCAIIHEDHWSILKNSRIADWFALSEAHVPTVRALLELGANVDIECDILSRRYKPLHIAAYHCDTTMMQLLLQYGALVDDRVTEIVFTQKDIRKNGYERIQSVLEARQSSRLGVETVLSGRRLDSPGHETPNGNRSWDRYLRESAKFGQLSICTVLLNERRVNVNAGEEATGLTALHFASQNDHLEVVEALFHCGADLGIVDEEGKTALHHVVAGQHYRCLPFLLQQNPDIYAVDKLGRTIWHEASLSGNTKAMEILLQDGASLAMFHQLRQEKGVSILANACRKGSVEAVTLLVSVGCGLNDVDSDGCTMLHHAAQAGSPELVRYMISEALDVKAVTDDGSSIMHHAMKGNESGFEQTVELLLESGVDPFRADVHGITPIMVLIDKCRDFTEEMYPLTDRSQKLCVLQRLVRLPDSYQGKHRAVVQALSFICRLRLGLSFGDSPFSKAFKLLLENGANLGSKTHSGTLAFEELVDAWRDECARLRLLTSDSYNHNWGFTQHHSMQMMHLALGHVPCQGPLHEICASPGLLAIAIGQRDGDLVQKLLKHDPNVDALVGHESYSPIRLACRHGCSRKLLQDLLSRSKTAKRDLEGSELLREACKTKSQYRNEMVQELLANNMNPNVPSAQGETALMHAAGDGDTATIDLLLEHGSDPTATTSRGCTVAHFAASSGNTDVLRFLECQDIDWNARATTKVGAYDRQDVTLLHLAAVCPDLSMLYYLLERGCVSNIDSMTDLKETVLYCAARLGRSQNVSLLLSKGADSTLIASTGFSPVHTAAFAGRTNTMLEFMKHGCNLNLKNSGGLNCEMIARKCGHKELAVIIEEHCRKEGQDQDTRIDCSTTNFGGKASEPLRIAIQTGDLALCERALEDDIALDAGYEDCDGCTPLLYSLYHEQQAMAQQLVLKGASPTGKVCRYYNREGLSAFALAAGHNFSELVNTLLDRCLGDYLCLHRPIHPLHLAIFRRSADCVEVIIGHAENQPKPDSLNPQYDTNPYPQSLSNLRVGTKLDPMTPSLFDWNATPLNIAAAVDDVKIARRLLAAGALVNVGNALGLTPLHTAAAVGNIKMIEMLLSSGANVHVKDHVLETPAMKAVIGGHLDAFQLLSSCGSDLLEVNSGGATMLHLAALHGRTAILVYLEMVMSAFDLAIQDKFGHTVLITAIDSNSTALPKLLQNTPNIKAYSTTQYNTLTWAVRNSDMRPILIRALLRRISPDCWEELLAYRTRVTPTPLYAAATSILPPLQEDRILLLLDFGADLETDGGDHGTALMGACAAGRFEAVQLLVRKGAKMVYTKDGQVFSALRAAKQFPEIVQWLLVGRHVDSPLLLTENGEETEV